MKELTTTYSDLLQDKRVRSEQSKYETATRQRTSVMTKYRKIYEAFGDLNAGLMRAQGFYSEMRDTVDSLNKNVEVFVNNRRSEGAQLLNQIERDRAGNSGGQANQERERLRELMERMSMDPSTSPSKAKSGTPRPQQLPQSSYPSSSYPATSPPITPRYPSASMTGQYNVPKPQSPAPTQAQYGYQQYAPPNGNYHQQPRRDSANQSAAPSHDPYNPNSYIRRESYQTPVSPPPNQQYFSQPASQFGYNPQQQQQQQHLPPGYVPPPPPPGPPPPGSYPNHGGSYPAGYAKSPPPQGQYGAGQQQAQNDPWAGLNAWK